jgi:IMP dehydrogenase
VASGLEGTVRDSMTPRDQLVVGTRATALEDARRIMAQRRVEKLPLIDDAGRLAGLITMRDIAHLDLYPLATKDARGRLRVGAAIGVRGDYLDRARAVAEAGADVLCLDIAHGHAEHAIAATRELRRTVDIEIIAGNVATAEGARDLIEAGAHGIKVGVGPGSVCTTRLVAGVGVPQLTAIMECAVACHEAGIPLCADGGIRMPADMSKAIAAGGDTIMVGNMLAGTSQSPGTLLKRDGRTVKVHRGMASGGAMKKRSDMDSSAQANSTRLERRWMLGRENDAGEFGKVVAEGVEAVVPYRGDTHAVLNELAGGLRSAMSYSNSSTLEQYHERARFVRITAAGQVESHPHDVEV